VVLLVLMAGWGWGGVMMVVVLAGLWREEEEEVEVEVERVGACMVFGRGDVESAGGRVLGEVEAVSLGDGQELLRGGQGLLASGSAGWVSGS